MHTGRGILHDDDPEDRRWTLMFDNPKVLAYFGAQPNHP